MGERYLLVVIDDLDRLTPHEALEMIALVKSLGNLPNTIYLLSYDQDRLFANIRQNNIDPESYLSKIVQYAAWLPPVDEDTIYTLLYSDIQSIIGIIDETLRQSIIYIWDSALKYYITTPRDVKKYANGLAISFPALHDEIDIIDLLVLEAIRIFDAKFYAQIVNNATRLAG